MTIADPAVFVQILEDIGYTVQRFARTAGAADALGQPTYADAHPDVIRVIVQDMSTSDMRKYAGILQDGDLLMLTADATPIAPTDRVVLRNQRYMPVSETAEQVGTLVLYREYLMRRATP